MGIVIERARPEDAEAMLAYLKQIGGETDNLSFGAEGVTVSTEAEAARIKQILHSHDEIMLVAREDGRIVGDASLNRLPRRMRHRGEVGLAVVRSHWNRGVGGRLLSAVIDFARENDFEMLDLQVRCDNQAAIHLYEKCGFRKLYTYDGYFKINGENVDFDFMRLKL